METGTNKSFIERLFSLNGFQLKPESLDSKQTLTLWSFIVISVVLRILLIPYNMMDMGDSATRVWNALYWAQHPFFIMPQSGYPGWFYLMGPVIMATGEYFYTSAIVMILLMTLAGYYIFKTTLVLSGFRAALISYCIFILNPAVFRLNFEPYAQQPYLAMAAVMIFFFVKAMGSDNSRKYFLLSGLFALLGLFQRFEIIFIAVPLCIVAVLSHRKGWYHFVWLSLFFQIAWLIFSKVATGNALASYQVVSDYIAPLEIQGMSLGVRLQGFFLPYYFIFLGVTLFLFWYMLKGFLYAWRNYPRSITMTLLIAILAPALLNGTMSLRSTLYYMTHYMYFAFFFPAVFAAIGLSQSADKLKSHALRISFVSVVILTCIPLSYIKEAAPGKTSKLFPKVLEFIVTAENPGETQQLLNFIDANIKNYPALVLDVEQSESSIFYVAYRTKLAAVPADDPKILMTGYNVPRDAEGLREPVRSFLLKNKSGIVMLKKSETALNKVFSELTTPKNYVRNDFSKAAETQRWIIYTYKSE